MNNSRKSKQFIFIWKLDCNADKRSNSKPERLLSDGTLSNIKFHFECMHMDERILITFFRFFEQIWYEIFIFDNI